jgi:hypothetical protein
MIVIHIDSKDDTKLLKHTYDGLSGIKLLYNPTHAEVVKALEENPTERVMMMGHGSPSGLFSADWKGDVISGDDIELLKGRECIGIWCWAKKFAKQNGLKGFFTDMFISNEGEAKMYGYSAGNAEVFDEVELFSERVNKLLAKDVPLSKWVERLRKAADYGKGFVKYNYDGLEYFDGTQLTDFEEPSLFGDTYLSDSDSYSEEERMNEYFETFLADYSIDKEVEGTRIISMLRDAFDYGWYANGEI